MCKVLERVNREVLVKHFVGNRMCTIWQYDLRDKTPCMTLAQSHGGYNLIIRWEQGCRQPMLLF